MLDEIISLNNIQKTFLQSEVGRDWFIQKVLKTVPKDENWQQNHTPYDLCERIIEKTSYKDKKILVLFNIEFVEILIKKKHISPSNIVFVSDCNIEKEIVKKIYNLGKITIVKNIRDLKKFYGIGDKMKEKPIDLCFSNPPYNNGVDLQIIEETLKVCNEMVVVHPSRWLLDLKGKWGPFKTIKTTLKHKIKSISLFNGNKVFKIYLFNPCSITHITDENNSIIEIDYFENIFYTNDLSDVTIYGPEWFSIVRPFVETIKRYISEHESIWGKNVYTLSDTQNICQLPAVRGNVSKENPNKIVEDDFYTLLRIDSDHHKNLNQTNLKADSPPPTYKFNDEKERDNFIDYLKTDFVRFCLSVYKTSGTTYAGELELIPWLNFKYSWSDYELYSCFDIDKKTIDYIENFLPDYYGIRK